MAKNPPKRRSGARATLVEAGRRLTKRRAVEQIDLSQISVRLEAGTGIAQLARELEVDYALLRNRLVREGLSTTRPEAKRWPAETKARAVALRWEGLSYKQICEQIGCTTTTLERWLRRAGLLRSKQIKPFKPSSKPLAEAGLRGMVHDLIYTQMRRLQEDQAQTQARLASDTKRLQTLDAELSRLREFSESLSRDALLAPLPQE